MNKAQRITGTLFVVIGVYVTWYSFSSLGVGSISKPGPGFFTLVCGLGIFILAAIWVISGIRKQEGKGRLWEKGGWISPLLAIGVTFLYALLMSPLGYVISTAIFIILWQVVISKGSRVTIIVFTIVGTGVLYIIFGPLLSVPLPRGVFGF